jgi:hypothetical protein
MSHAGRRPLLRPATPRHQPTGHPPATQQLQAPHGKMMHSLRREKEKDKTQYLVHIAAKIKKIKFLIFDSESCINN